MRILHTMLRVGDLQRSVKFYTEVLGMKLLRTTDRPEQKYSLAFVGYDTEGRTAVLQLAYNYGVGRYDLRGAVAHLCRRAPESRAGLRARAQERRQGDARGRPGQGRHLGHRLRRRPGRLQDRVHRDERARLTTSFRPSAAQVPLRRGLVDQRIEIEMSRDDVGPGIQKRVQLLVRAHIEQSNRASPGARMDEPAPGADCL